MIIKVHNIISYHRRECIGSLSRFDIYYKRVYLKAPAVPDFIKYKRSPKKWAKKWRKRRKQKPPFLGHKLNIGRGAYSKHPRKSAIPVFAKRDSPRFAPSFAKNTRSTLFAA
jgi:hypothetical protein